MNKFRDKRIFISGGAGVIGRELVLKLLAAGATLFVGDLKPCPNEFKGRIRYRQGDLNYLMQAEIEAFSPEVFIHLAATFERSTESYEFWQENFWHNVRLSNHLMTLIKDLPSLRKVVFASSYLIYDPRLYNFSIAQKEPVSLKETDPIYPRNLTGMAKLSHEIELRFIEEFKSAQYEIIIARIFRGYGRNSRDIISRWVRSLLAGEEISVFRKEGIFDYIYAVDTAEGLIRLAGSKKAKGIVNLGTGKSRRVADVLEVLSQHFPQMKVEESESDIPFEASQANIDLLFQFTGWLPQYDIENAVPEIIAHEKNRSRFGPIEEIGNILVTSASRKVPMIQAVKRAAAKLSPAIKVFAGDMDSKALTRSVADGFFQMPKTCDQDLNEIISWCSENNVRFIIPSRDGELEFWARNRDLLNNKGIHVMISKLDSVTRCLDKLKFFQYCDINCIPVIPSYLQANEVLTDKLVVKERWGAGSLSIAIGLSKTDAIEHGMKLESPIYQPMLSGDEITVDAYVDACGAVHGIIMRKRDKVVNGEAQVTTTFIDAEMENIFTKIIRKLDLYGHILLQAFVGEQKDIHLIECNCRFGGASTLSVMAGLDSFYWFLLESSGADLKDYSFVPPKRTICQIRVPHDLYINGTDI
jgi:carbamoyl-phosphate synthase large subunit